MSPKSALRGLVERGFGGLRQTLIELTILMEHFGVPIVVHSGPEQAE